MRVQKSLFTVTHALFFICNVLLLGSQLVELISYILCEVLILFKMHVSELIGSFLFNTMIPVSMFRFIVVTSHFCVEL